VNSPIFLQDYKRLQDYNQSLCRSSDLSLFYDLVLSVSHIYSVMLYMQIDFTQYCDILLSFERWFGLRSLREFYQGLSDNVQYIPIYYKLVDSDFTNQMEFSDFIPILDKAVNRII
jgi:hypothetical protein